MLNIIPEIFGIVLVSWIGGIGENFFGSRPDRPSVDGLNPWSFLCQICCFLS